MYQISYNQPFGLYLPTQATFINTGSSDANPPEVTAAYYYDAPENQSIFVFSNNVTHPDAATGPVDLTDPNLTVFDVTFNYKGDYFVVGADELEAKQLAFNSTMTAQVVDWNGDAFTAENSSVCPLKQVGLMYDADFLAISSLYTPNRPPAKLLVVPVYDPSPSNAAVSMGTFVACVNKQCQDISTSVTTSVPTTGWDLSSGGVASCGPSTYKGNPVFNSMNACKTICPSQPPPPSPTPSKKNWWIIVGALVGVVLVIVVIAIILMWAMNRRE